ncbi:uncharacterized protein LY79DRAFT_271022 [Colletotrichum navitas]|uniref:Uncharacterized protein n=1 Tax=Colletotrichum navitas TaxID=681940 RepID=A0AAD8V441_9PEZI|nr:uncharacterized protein LY79DRAFT_271022 [Colletotrichum navitas]KAK1585339.1 hypothetical protein LY79DRAFT_271022 [Colletotrichum navitas]
MTLSGRGRDTRTHRQGTRSGHGTDGQRVLIVSAGHRHRTQPIISRRFNHPRRSFHFSPGGQGRAGGGRKHPTQQGFPFNTRATDGQSATKSPAVAGGRHGSIPARVQFGMAARMGYLGSRPNKGRPVYPRRAGNRKPVAGGLPRSYREQSWPGHTEMRTLWIDELSPAAVSLEHSCSNQDRVP